MNLYGWHLSSFTKVLGSRDSTTLETAAARLNETLQKEPSRSTAMAWLRTLIEKGFPLRQDRYPQAEAADGGLLTVQMETEAHAFVVYCVMRAIAGADHLDLASESSSWAHPAVGSLYQDLASCDFTRSKNCNVK